MEHYKFIALRIATYNHSSIQRSRQDDKTGQLQDQDGEDDPEEDPLSDPMSTVGSV
jgi:hypothetical protein